MAEAVIDPTQGAVFIPDVWSKFVVKALHAEYIMPELTWRFDADVLKYGQVIHVPKVSNLKAVPVGPDGSISPQAPLEGSYTITVNQESHAAFDITDREIDQAMYDITAFYTEKAGLALAEELDLDILGLYPNVIANNQNNVTGSIGDANVLNAVAELDIVKTPVTNRFAVVSPGQKNAILAIDKYYHADWNAQANAGKDQSAIATGKFVRDFYGVKFFWSPLVPRVSATYTYSMMFHKESFGLAMQKKLHSEFFRLKFSRLYAARHLFGYSAIRCLEGTAAYWRTTDA